MPSPTLLNPRLRMRRASVPVLLGKGVYYGMRLLVRPADIRALLGLGDLLSETRAFDEFVERVQKDPDAQVLIRERYAPGLPALGELSAYPEGSLGLKLAEQMARFGLDLYPKRFANSSGSDRPGIYLRERQREIHDLLHTLLGQGIELSEEAHVNAFMMAQSGSPVSILVVCGAILRTVFCISKPSELSLLLRQVQAGYAQGLRARNIFGIRWEEKLGLSLEDAKRLLGVT
jgi:ubiquinone biosynthesis protein COQ4